MCRKIIVYNCIYLSVVNCFHKKFQMFNRDLNKGPVNFRSSPPITGLRKRYSENMQQIYSCFKIYFATLHIFRKVFIGTSMEGYFCNPLEFTHYTS